MARKVLGIIGMWDSRNSMVLSNSLLTSAFPKIAAVVSKEAVKLCRGGPEIMNDNRIELIITAKTEELLDRNEAAPV
jgi:hypothetical protein